MRRLLPILLLPMLAACSALGGGKQEAPAEAAAAARPEAVPVEDVTGIEVGRTRDGVLLTAWGIAPGLGYSTELRPRRGGQLGTDGFLDYDFLVRPPASGFNLGQGAPSARQVQANLLLTPRDARGAVGLRIHGASGGRQVMF